MSLGDRFPIDPLSERDWSDVERAVHAELEAEPGATQRSPARSRRVAISAVAGVAALAAVAALLVAAFRVEAPTPLQTTRLEAAGEAVRAVVGDVSLRLSAGAELVVVDHAQSGTIATLERGEVHFAVPPRAGRAPFVVQAADVRVEVVGTRFSVSRRGARVDVAVERGLVRVTHDGASVLLEAGERWSMDAHEPPPPAAERAPAPTQAPIETRQASIETPAPVRGVERSRERTASLEPATAPREPLIEDSRALFDRAASLERDDPARALALYARLVARGDGWGPAALFAQARLEHDRGNQARATQLLRLYLERHPRGTNADDARRLLSRRP